MIPESAPTFESRVSRRDACKLALGCVAAAWAARAAPAAPAAASRIIDTHTHFYNPTRPQGVPWPAPGSALYRRVLPPDWLALAGRHGIRDTVVVEASKWMEDNDWILELAKTEPSIVGFVGHLQPADPDFSPHLKRLAANPIFRGVRVSGRDLLDRVESAEFLTGAKQMAAMGLSMDVNGVSDPARIAILAARVPDLRIVIDHCGNCGDAQKLKQVWKDGMNECARHRQIFCKVSALAEMADAPPGKAPTDTAYYQPVLDHLWAAFGEERLIFGSNWPVSDKGATYDVVFKIVREYFASHGTGACENYFWKNSLKAYHWVERR